jgi:hypothetical protein
MMRKLLAALVVVLTIGVPLRAELKYTMKMEMHASSVPSSEPADPMMAMIGNMMVDMLVPPGGVEMTCVVGDKGARVEYSKAYLMMPAGAVTIIKPDGSMVVINPAARTYWKVAAMGTALPPGMSPVVTTKRTGEFADVAGVRSERVTVDIRIAIPLPPGVQAPPGMPTELTMAGDLWMTDRFKAFTNASAAALGLKSLGFEKTLAGEMPMRTVLRSALFGGKEMETVVLKIGEEAVPAGLFDLPADYKEIPAPTGIGGIGGAR